MSFICNVSVGSCDERSDICAIVLRRNDYRNGLAGLFEEVSPLQVERPLVHPDESGLATTSERCWRLLRNEKIPSADIQFAIKSKRHRHRSVRLSKSPSYVTMRVTYACRPEGRTLMLSPGQMVPEEICPAKPRKLASGRNTRCTGKRNGAECLSEAEGRESSSSSKDGPPYQGMASERRAMLSPISALTGTKTAATGLPVSALI